MHGLDSLLADLLTGTVCASSIPGRYGYHSPNDAVRYLRRLLKRSAYEVHSKNVWHQTKFGIVQDLEYSLKRRY